MRGYILVCGTSALAVAVLAACSMIDEELRHQGQVIQHQTLDDYRPEYLLNPVLDEIIEQKAYPIGICNLEDYYSISYDAPHYEYGASSDTSSRITPIRTKMNALR